MARLIKTTGGTVVKANERIMNSKRVSKVLSSNSALAKELKDRRISSDQIREAGAMALRSLRVVSS